MLATLRASLRPVVPVPLRRALRLPASASRSGTLRWHLAAGARGPEVIVYPNVHQHVARDAACIGAGRLHLGRRYEAGRALPSELRLHAGATLQVDGSVSIYTGHCIAVNEGARLRLGSGYVNPQATIDCFESIWIGERVAVAKQVLMRDSDDHLTREGGVRRAAIEIGDDVWIGMRATILKGVRIGDGAVVAAGALVRGDVPPRCLVGGVPARILRRDVTWRR